MHAQPLQPALNGCSVECGALESHVQGIGQACTGHWTGMYRALDRHVQSIGQECTEHWTCMYSALDRHAQGTGKACTGHWIGMYRALHRHVQECTELDTAVSRARYNHA